jgi:hypothetical protein
MDRPRRLLCICDVIIMGLCAGRDLCRGWTGEIVDTRISHRPWVLVTYGRTRRRWSSRLQRSSYICVHASPPLSTLEPPSSPPLYVNTQPRTEIKIKVKKTFVCGRGEGGGAYRQPKFPDDPNRPGVALVIGIKGCSQSVALAAPFFKLCPPPPFPQNSASLLYRRYYFLHINPFTSTKAPHRSFPSN